MLILVYEVLINLCGVLRDDIFYKSGFNFRIKWLICAIQEMKIGGLEELFRRAVRVLLIPS